MLADHVVSMAAYEQAKIAIDCTAGGGGHLKMALDRMPQGGKLLAFDRDTIAIQHLQQKFAAEIASKKLVLIHGTFSELEGVLKQHPEFNHPDVILADLGVSSPQLDQEARGFSFQTNGPLDMRMNQNEETETAADIVNTWEEVELTKLFRTFGEEPKARFVARAITDRRNSEPFSQTADLAEVVAKSIHYKEKSRKHPATRIFQALRIQVNHEMDELDTLLSDAFSCLRKGGRLAVITFHSLEDKAVKRKFRELAGKTDRADMLSKLPFSEHDLRAAVKSQGKILKPFPASATENELNINPRSRSAKLRVIEKL